MLEMVYFSNMLGEYRTVKQFLESLAHTCDLQVNTADVWDSEDQMYQVIDMDNTCNWSDLNVTTCWIAKILHNDKYYFAVSPHQGSDVRVGYYDCYLYEISDDFDMYFIWGDAFAPFIQIYYITNQNKTLFVANAEQSSDIYRWEISNVDTDVLKELDADEPILQYAEGEPLDENIFKKYVEMEY